MRSPTFETWDPDPRVAADVRGRDLPPDSPCARSRLDLAFESHVARSESVRDRHRHRHLAFSAAPAEAGRRCPYWVLVSRDGFPQENVARVCEEDMGTILRWMRVVPGAAVSHRVPQVPLNDGFTVTIGVIKAGQEVLAPLDRSVVLMVRVYPLAPSGPAAFVHARTSFHGPKPFPPGFVVSSGRRSLDASDQVPTVLTALGMLQPTPRTTRPTTPAPTPPAAAPTPGSRPGPDAVTLLFLLALLVAAGAVARRSIGRTRPETQDGFSGQSEVPHGE
jgi:hypothetical protein